eukprot:gene10087-18988_t
MRKANTESQNDTELSLQWLSSMILTILEGCTNCTDTSLGIKLELKF